MTCTYTIQKQKPCARKLESQTILLQLRLPVPHLHVNSHTCRSKVNLSTQHPAI